MNKPTYEELEIKVHEAAQRLYELEFKQLWGAYSESPIPTLILNREGNIVVFNNPIANLVGYTREEIEKTPSLFAWIKKVMPDEKYARETIEITRQVLGREIDVIRREFIITKKDGKQCFVEFSAFDVMQEGKPTEFKVLQGVDITPRKQAEQRMRESEERYSALFQRSLDFVYISDFEGNIIDANPAALSLLGYKKEDIASMNFSKIICEDQVPKAFETLGEIVHNGYQKGLTEFTLKRVNGEFVHVQTNGSLICRDGKPYAVLGIGRDITERRKTEQKLRSALEKLYEFESIVNRSQIVVCLRDKVPDGPIEFVSDNVRQFGYQPEDFMSGKITCFDIICPEDISRIKAEIAHCVQNEIMDFCLEYRVLTKSGEIRWVRDHTKAILNSEGIITHYQAIILDVTERKKAEEIEKRTIKRMNFLAEKAIELVQLSSDDNIYQIIGEKLKEITGDALVSVAVFDESNSIMENKAIIGLDDKLKTVINMMGRNPFGMKFVINEKQQVPISTGRLTKIEGGIFALMFGKVPKIICKTIESMFNIKDIYGIGFVNKGKIYGVTTIITFKDTEPLDFELIETFCNQVSVALQRWLAENAVRVSEEKYHTLADNINDIIYSVDEYGIIKYVGPQITRYGYNPEEIVSRPFLEFVLPEDHENTMKDFKKSIETGEEFPTYFRIKDKKGEIYWVEDNGMIQRNETGKIIGLTGILRDITERKQAEEALKISEAKLRDQKSALEQKNIALREIIGQIEIEKNSIKDEIITNVNEIMLPILKKLKIRDESNEYIDLLQHLLENLTSSFGRKITKSNIKLTPREIEISTMIESGLTTKEISKLLNISAQTVEKHRKNIRKKLDITHKNYNLSSYLQHL
jgi:PAS domain S-box-containing protein